MNKTGSRLIKFLLILPMVVLHSFSAMSQSDNLYFKHLNKKNGLSNNHVNSVFEDSRGFIWIATSDGLNRYDGYKFKVFKNDINNPNSLPNNFVLCMAEDTLKNLWIGTNQSGLTRYNLIEEKFHNYYHILEDSSTIPGTVIRKILIDTKNNVWVCTDFGFARYLPSTDTFKRYKFPIDGGKVITNADVVNAFQVDDNEILIQCDFGVYSLNVDNDKVSREEFSSSSFLKDLLTYNSPLLFTDKYTFWLGYQNGLILFDSDSNQFKQYRNTTSQEKPDNRNYYSIIFQDSEKRIWIGTLNNGINLFNEVSNDFTVYNTSNSLGDGLTDNLITHIYEDSKNNIWFSTQEGGVSYISTQTKEFDLISNNPINSKTLSSDRVNSIYEDDYGTIWIGTRDGILNKMLGYNEFEKYPLIKDKTYPNISGMTRKDKNSFFIAGWGIGLYEFNSKKGSSRNLMQQRGFNGQNLPDNIKGLGTDRDGNIWLAAHNETGLLVYSPSENRFYDSNNSGPFSAELLSTPYAATIFEDSKSRIWIVSYTGLYMYDSSYHYYKNIPEDNRTLSSDYVYTLFEDSNNQLWVGSSNGLDKIVEDGKVIRFERFSHMFPIPNNIKGILQDKKGNLWLSSNSELTRFHPETKLIRHFKISNELPSQEFYERSCLMASDGLMYFGGSKGFIRFHPDSITDYEEESAIYITDFSLFNKSQIADSSDSPLSQSIIETKAIELKHSQSVLSFEYAAINFNPYKTIEYAYKMEGFDKEWNFVGEKRSVTYINLPAGEYSFRVKTVTAGTLSKNSALLKIKIHPPYWKTKLAYAIYSFIFMGLLYLFRKSILNREKLRNELKLEKIKIKNVRESNLMKLRFFTNISHEFRTPLTLIKAPLEKLTANSSTLTSKESKYHLKLIENNTERLLKMINQLMDYRKLEAGSLVLEPSHGDIIDFCKQTWTAFSFIAKEKKIKYNFYSEIEKLQMSFDADKMDKILSNLLSNAFKYTQEYGQIILSISLKKNDCSDSNCIEIIIQDTGIGINENDTAHIFDRFYSVKQKRAKNLEGTGIGLALAKELTELHKGEIIVESEEGKGATFKVQLPIVSYSQIETNPVEPYNIDLEEKTKIQLQTTEVIDANQKNKKDKILLVEDDDELRNFLSTELSQDYNLIVAKDGDEGLRKAFFDIPDLVLSDVMMPNIDGFELCKTLKSDERTSHIPIILLTARHSQEQQLEGFDAGANDYVFKPFSIQILKSRIQNILFIRKSLIEKFNKGESLYFDGDGIEEKEKLFIQSIIDIVLDNITHENINADFISNKLHISRSLVYLKIEAMAGQTVNEFVRNIRLKKSLALLKHNNQTITEIAYAVGFSSHSYYSRSFTKLFGVSPKDYVKNKDW